MNKNLYKNYAPRVRLAFFLLLAWGCSTPGAAPPAPIEATDDLGRAVRLAEPAARVLSLAPGNTEVVFALGAEGLLVGRSDACDFPPEAARVPSVGGLFPPDHERILATRPDLVLMIDGAAPLRERLGARGVPVYVHQPRTFEGNIEGILRIGHLLGRDEAASQLVRGIRARLQQVRETLPEDRPTVFYEVWPEPLTSVGPGTFLADLIRLAGGRSVVTDPGQDWPRYPVERLVQADPEVIVTAHAATRTSAAQRPGWGALKAVRGGRVEVLKDADVLVRSGPRVALGVERLAAAIHRR